MGSMGRRRGRRTRSDSGGTRRQHRRNTGDWPGFEHSGLTYEGEIARAAQLGRGWRAVRERGRKSVSNWDLFLGIALAMLGLVVLSVALGTVLLLIF